MENLAKTGDPSGAERGCRPPWERWSWPGHRTTVPSPLPALFPLQGTLTFSKELPKSLAGGLLPSPLAVAAVMAAAAGSPLSLRPAPAAPLLQGPPITHPLLHPAPGPIRTAHGPILFSPY